MRVGGIPFSITHDFSDDSIIQKSINYRKSGGQFISAKQSLENMRTAIKTVVEHGAYFELPENWTL
jgi:hypothetical protein